MSKSVFQIGGNFKLIQKYIIQWKKFSSKNKQGLSWLKKTMTEWEWQILKKYSKNQKRLFSSSWILIKI